MRQRNLARTRVAAATHQRNRAGCMVRRAHLPLAEFFRVSGDTANKAIALLAKFAFRKSDDGPPPHELPKGAATRCGPESADGPVFAAGPVAGNGVWFDAIVPTRTCPFEFAPPDERPCCSGTPVSARHAVAIGDTRTGLTPELRAGVGPHEYTAPPMPYDDCTLLV